MNFENCLGFLQCPWHPEKYIGTPCRRYQEKKLPFLETDELP